MNQIKLASYGVIVAILYGLLYSYEQEVIRLCKQGGWYFLFPVGVAFVLSIFHGTFTSLFWDALGVKAKQTK